MRSAGAVRVRVSRCGVVVLGRVVVRGVSTCGRVVRLASYRRGA